MKEKSMMEQKLEHMQAGRPLNMDDTFNFGCIGCGDCCYGHSDILLSGHDLFSMAKHLQITIEDVISRYCIVNIGVSTHLPVITLAQKEDGACPLLNGTKCLVHQAKPATCAIYPIGRMVDSDSKNVQYILQDKKALPSGCSHTYKKYTLREWLSEFNIDENDPNILAWYEAIFTIVENPFMEIYRERFNTFSEKINQFIISLLMNRLYLRFDADNPYTEQLKCNVKHIEYIFAKFYRVFFTPSSLYYTHSDK